MKDDRDWLVAAKRDWFLNQFMLNRFTKLAQHVDKVILLLCIHVCIIVPPTFLSGWRQIAGERTAAGWTVGGLPSYTSYQPYPGTLCGPGITRPHNTLTIHITRAVIMKMLQSVRIVKTFERENFAVSVEMRI